MKSIKIEIHTTEVDILLGKLFLHFLEIKIDDLHTEQRYLEKEISSSKNEELSELLEKRLDRIEKEISLRVGVKEYNRDRFQGLFSYSVKVFYNLFLN